MKCIYMPQPEKVYTHEVDIPIYGEEDVLIKVHTVGLCGTDLHSYRGSAALTKYPLIPGHEIGGHIVSLGKKVPATYKENMKVTVKPYFNCGVCYSCSIQRINACKDSVTLGVQIPGALCEYIAVNFNNVITCSDLSYEELALIEPLAVGTHLSNRTKVCSSDIVLVFGCGVIGLGAISACYLKGATVIAVDIADKKLELAKHMGAEYVINSKKQDVEKIVNEITRGQGAHVVLEAIGFNETMAQSIELVSFSGRVGYVGYGSGNLHLNSNVVVKKELNISGSRNSMHSEFIDVIQNLSYHKLPFHRLITEKFIANDAAKAFELWNKNQDVYTKIQIIFE